MAIPLVMAMPLWMMAVDASMNKMGTIYGFIMIIIFVILFIPGSALFFIFILKEEK
jgi:hypothetical protein